MTPRKRDGGRLSGRIEAEAALILERVAAKRDITLKELKAELASAEYGSASARCGAFSPGGRSR